MTTFGIVWFVIIVLVFAICGWLCVFIIPSALLMFLANRPLGSLVGLFIMSLTLEGILSRKLAYPEMSDEELTAPEPPLSLLPK